MANFLWKTGGGSALTKQAMQIAADIVEYMKKDTYTTQPYTPVEGRAETLRANVRDILRKEGIGQRVNTAIDGNVLFVHVKELSRIEKLERLVEKMMFETDNETLYEEAMEVLYGNG